MDGKTTVTVLKHGIANVRDLNVVCPDCGAANWQLRVSTEQPATGQTKCANCGAVLEYLEVY